MPTYYSAYKQRLIWYLLLFVYALACIYAAGGEMRGDEIAHFAQIELFRTGDGTPWFRYLVTQLTTVPGYHFFVAGIMRLFDFESLAAVRCINGIFSLLAVWGFDRVYRAVHGRANNLALVQFAALPILAPVLFLAYTDVLGLALVLWATVFTLRGRDVYAGITMIAAMAVRQNNVLWIGFLWTLMAWPLWKQAGWAAWRAIVWRSLTYAAAGLSFVAYWLWHGSISYSTDQAGMHPDISLHVGNFYFMLLVAAALFPFHCLEGWVRFVRSLRERPLLSFIPLTLLVLYFFAFTVDHPFNLCDPAPNNFSLRNCTLEATKTSSLWHIALGIVATFAAVGIVWQRLAQPVAIMLYPFAVMFVMLSWLIEQRYYLIPFSLFLAWRLPGRRITEWATVALWLVLAVLFLWGEISGRLYL